MALNQFIVLKRKGQWAVKSNDQERSCSSQLEAIHAAIELANECGKNGRASVVLLQAAKNQFETIVLATAVGGLLARPCDRRRAVEQKRGAACGASSVSEP